MTTTPLDAQTGLPVPPKDHGWEVREFHKYAYNHYSYAKGKVRDGYSVCLVRKVTVPAKVTKGGDWWSLSKHTPAYETSRVVHEQQIVDPERLPKDNEITPYGWPIGKKTITAADVLEAAQVVLARVEEAEQLAELKRRSDSLLGAYPPKKLT